MLPLRRGNLTVIPLQEVLKPEMLRGWVDETEYMRTVCVVVPKYVTFYLKTLSAR